MEIRFRVPHDEGLTQTELGGVSTEVDVMRIL